MKEIGFSIQLLGVIFAVIGVAGSLFMAIFGAILGVGGLSLVVLADKNR